MECNVFKSQLYGRGEQVRIFDYTAGTHTYFAERNYCAQICEQIN